MSRAVTGGQGDGPAAAGGEVTELDATLRPGRPEERWLEQALGINEAVARRLARQLGRGEVADELMSAGRLALVSLLRRYQPVRAALTTYLMPRLRWAMLDAVRRDTHGRVVARRSRALAASQRLADEPDEAGVRHALPDEQGGRQALAALLRQHGTALGLALAAGGDEEPRVPSTLQPDRVVSKRRGRERLREAVAALAEPRERELVRRHYFEGVALSAVGAEMGISKSWASRLHARAIRSLARVLGEDPGGR